MPNPDSGNLPSDRGGNPSTKVKSTRGSTGKVAEKTAAWPGLPGKAQPRNRSAGVNKLKVHSKSEGL